MIEVIQCSASKRPDAGHLVTASGKLVDFVAHPQMAPRDLDRLYARPDDLCEDGISWRQFLLKYNNPLLCLQSEANSYQQVRQGRVSTQGNTF